MVIVSGFEKNIAYQRCKRCIADSTVPGISFDLKGECNLCKMHDRWEKLYPNDERGAAILQNKFEQIKKDAGNGKYDVVIGISGGRDSIYLLYLAVTKWKLRPLAVHFNDGFDNPVAGENMLKAVKKLNVELRTITSDFRECKDLKIVDLKASTPLMNNGTDVGIGASLYGVAYKEKVKHILFGQSFRTEGIRPLAWAYFDGDHLRALHKQFGTHPLRKWTPTEPGYGLGIKEMFFYSVLHGIKVFSPLYYHQYVKADVQKILERELDWVLPGSHYADDLYWSLITYIHRVKFNIDFRLIEYSAFIRSGQMTRDEALEKINRPDEVMENEKIISLCIKRLGITREQFDEFMKLPPKNFWDYPNSYSLLQLGKPVVWLMVQMGVFTQAIYDKYFTIKFR
jgi:tRNA(Ile)-lysidine synthase TilS/MesJ